jgi:hypothetical protein
MKGRWGSYLLFLFACLYFSVFCKLRARGAVRVGGSLNLLTRSGVLGEGPTLMMSAPAR